MDRSSTDLSLDVLRERLREVRDADLVTGSREADGAHSRAAEVMRFASGGDLEFWKDQATRILALYLHAAALGGKALDQVQNWINASLDEDAQDEIRTLPSTSRGAGAALQAFDRWRSTPALTAAAIRSTMGSALARFQNADPTDPALPQ